jgi:N-acetylglucosamine kinase-like BadF-type ATPase
MSLFVGISGGHHQSTAIAYDSVSDCLVPQPDRICKHKPINPHSRHTGDVLPLLEGLLDELAKEAGLGKTDGLLASCSGLVLAVPGAGTPDTWRLAQEVLEQLGCHDLERFRAVDDTWAGLYADTCEATGICAFAGTGASVSVSLGKFVPDKQLKIDGWGPLIGDFGSGFQLVTDFFRKLGRCLDKLSTHCPPLFEDMRIFMPTLPAIHDVQQWFDYLCTSHPYEWRTTFASLAEPITQAADRHPNPDALALKLVRRCARDMAKSITMALNRLDPANRSIPLVFQGGMFRHSKSYLRTVLNALDFDVAARARIAQFEPVYGSLFLAAGTNRHRVRDLVAKQSIAGNSVPTP